MPTAVDVLEMQHIGDADDGAPDAIACIPKPRVRRQVRGQWRGATHG